jgi:hypothetical protein
MTHGKIISYNRHSFSVIDLYQPNIMSLYTKTKENLLLNSLSIFIRVYIYIYIYIYRERERERERE